MSRNGKSLKESKLVISWNRAYEWELTVKGHERSYWGYSYVPKLGYGAAAQLRKSTKNHCPLEVGKFYSMYIVRQLS